MPKFLKTTLFFCLLFSLLFAKPLLAANIFFDTPKNSFAVEEEFLVSVFLDAKGEALNALEGKILLASNQAEFKEIRSGNSTVPFWIEEPSLSSNGEIIFSGIIPGGLMDSKIFLFSIVVKTTKSGSEAIKVTDLRVLKNDGLGTPLESSADSFDFSISNINASPNEILPIIDSELPESFIPIIERDPNIFDNKYFLVFATQDKGSGIDNYKVREGSWGLYKVVKSPYLLENQKLDQQIFVKATDKAGNYRIITLEAKNKAPWYNNYIFLVSVIILTMLLVFYIVKKIWRKSTK